jgi:dipeptidyl aminopeptidase/acylaminoacyl peptidase
MKFHRMIALWVILAAAAGVARAQNPATPGSSSGSPAAGARVLTVDDYFRIREVGDPQISPDGKWVAYTVKTANLKEDKNRRRIWMVPLRGGTAIALTDENESSSHPRWSPDGKYLAFISAREGSGDDDDEEKGKKQVWILNREGGEAQQLTDTMQDVDSFAWAPASAGVAGCIARGNRRGPE